MDLSILTIKSTSSPLSSNHDTSRGVKMTESEELHQKFEGALSMPQFNVPTSDQMDKIVKGFRSSVEVGNFTDAYLHLVDIVENDDCFLTFHDVTCRVAMLRQTARRLIRQLKAMEAFDAEINTSQSSGSTITSAVK